MVQLPYEQFEPLLLESIPPPINFYEQPITIVHICVLASASQYLIVDYMVLSLIALEFHFVQRCHLTTLSLTNSMNDDY